MLLLAVGALAGCGQKGPLFLPPPRPAATAPAPAKATPKPAPALSAGTPAASSRDRR